MKRLSAVILLWLSLIASPTWGAIAFDASSGSRVNPGTSLTYSHTCTGTNRALVVGVLGDTAGDYVTGVTYNGVAMSKVAAQQTGGSRYLSFWYLNAPATGANNIVVTASQSIFIGAASASYTGVLQSGQPEANATNGAVSTGTLTCTVTTVTDNAWTVMSGRHQNAGLTASTGCVKRVDDLSGSGIVGIFDSNAALTPAGSKSETFTATNGGANPGGVIISMVPAASDSISITTPAQYQTFGRSGTTASIPITGTYSGSPTSIEASFNGGTYSTIVASPAGGTFSGTLSSQNQGQGTLTVRFTNNTSIIGTRANVGIGPVFLVLGDSHTEGRGTNPQSYSHATLKATAFRQDNAWTQANDPIDTGTSSGSHWPLLATYIMASQGVPVAFVTTGTGGTDCVVGGSKNTWVKGQTEYTNMLASITASGVTRFEGILAHLGGNATVDNPTLANYDSNIDSLITNLQSDVPGAPKLFLGIYGDGTGITRSAADNTRGAIVQVWSDNANIAPGPVLIDQLYSDSVHAHTNAELQVMADRWWFAMERSLYSGSNGRGPRISSATYNTAKDTITVTFDRTLASDSTYGGFRVLDNGVAKTISSVTRNGNTAVIVLSSACTTTTITVSLGSGADAAGQTIPRSTDVTLPGGGTIKLPVEPFFDYAATPSSTVAPAAMHYFRMQQSSISRKSSPLSVLNLRRYSIFETPYALAP